MAKQRCVPDNEIMADIGSLIKCLQKHGIVPEASFHDPPSFGNYYVEMSGENIRFRLIRDRGQYLIVGPEKHELDSVGLWRAFDDKQAFEQQVLQWLASKVMKCRSQEPVCPNP
jgi:hypothetical protein